MCIPSTRLLKEKKNLRQNPIRVFNSQFSFVPNVQKKTDTDGDREYRQREGEKSKPIDFLKFSTQTDFKAPWHATLSQNSWNSHHLTLNRKILQTKRGKFWRGGNGAPEFVQGQPISRSPERKPHDWQEIRPSPIQNTFSVHARTHCSSKRSDQLPIKTRSDENHLNSFSLEVQFRVFCFATPASDKHGFRREPDELGFGREGSNLGIESHSKWRQESIPHRIERFKIRIQGSSENEFRIETMNVGFWFRESTIGSANSSEQKSRQVRQKGSRTKTEPETEAVLRELLDRKHYL